VLVVTGLAREARIAAGAGVLVACSGGVVARLRECLDTLGPRKLRAVISFGLACGLDPTLQPGDVVLAVDQRTGVPRPADQALVSLLRARLTAGGINPRQGRVIGVDALLMDPLAKRSAYAQSKAAIADMESHVAADYADANGLAFAALRAVSDPAWRALPPLAGQAVRPDGRVNYSGVVAALARDPMQIGLLIRAGQDAARAFAALRRCRRLLGPGFGFGAAEL
jgi:hopanoid-associated phosphorylase